MTATPPATDVRLGVHSADLPADDDVVVFMIGMRVNRLRKVPGWLWVARQMPAMLRELTAQPDSPLLAARSWISGRDVMVVQVWRSADELGRYARDPESAHLPAWREFHRRMAGSGDVGIWHETYVCRAGDVETRYGDIPPTGLGAAFGLVPTAGRGRRTGRAEQRVRGAAI